MFSRVRSVDNTNMMGYLPIILGWTLLFTRAAGEESVRVVARCALTPFFSSLSGDTWKEDLINSSTVGSKKYLTSRRYKENKRPSICINNDMPAKYLTEPGEHGPKFLCPRYDESDAFVCCCGTPGQDKCCPHPTIARPHAFTVGLIVAIAISSLLLVCMVVATIYVGFRAQPPPPPRPSSPNVVVIGDSTTFVLTSDRVKQYTTALCTLESFSGAVPRTVSIPEDLSMATDIVLHVGTNCLANKMAELEIANSKDIASNITSTLDELSIRNSHANIIYSTILHRTDLTDNDGCMDEPNRKIDDINKIVRKHCMKMKYKCVEHGDIDALTDLYDGLHLNTEGADKFVKNITAVIKPATPPRTPEVRYQRTTNVPRVGQQADDRYKSNDTHSADVTFQDYIEFIENVASHESVESHENTETNKNGESYENKKSNEKVDAADNSSGSSWLSWVTKSRAESPKNGESHKSVESHENTETNKNEESHENTETNKNEESHENTETNKNAESHQNGESQENKESHEKIETAENSNNMHVLNVGMTTDHTDASWHTIDSGWMSCAANSHNHWQHDNIK